MNNLKTLRKEMGFIFKREMAYSLKINEANYGKMENGKMPITKPMIDILEDKFSQYNIKWILNNELPKYNTENTNDNIEQNQLINTHTQTSKNIMQETTDYKDIAMRSMAKRIEELENEVIRVTEEIQELKIKPKTQQAG